MLYIEYNAECRNLFNVMENVIMLSVVMLNVVLLSVVIPSVVIPSVVVPWIGILGTNTLAYYKLWL